MPKPARRPVEANPSANGSHLGDGQLRIVQEPENQARHIDYAKYLQTDHWQRTRTDTLAARGYKCEKCGQNGGELHVHHLSYERLGQERSEDLQVLCRKCHRSTHFPNGGEALNRAEGRTDVNNAIRLVTKHGEDLRWVGPWDKWLIWDGRRWEMDRALAIELKAKDIASDLFAEIATVLKEDRD